MTDTPRLTREIHDVLEDHPCERAPGVLAAEYARLCREVNERLDRILAMLESGGEIQALQLAEQQPRLMDRIVDLSFGDEIAWQEYCARHGHEVAPLIDAEAMERLEGIYAKGLAPNHPLYRDYRAAVLSRDDARAYELVRTISGLNPADENAAKELRRYQRKFLMKAREALQAALAAGDEEEVVRRVEEIEGLGDANEAERPPEWARAVSIRDGREREKALERMPELVGEAEEALRSEDWRAAAESMASFAALRDEHGVPDAGLAERAENVERSLEARRKADERAARIASLSASLAEIADDVEARSVTPAGLTKEFAEPRLEKLDKAHGEIKRLGGGPAAGLGNRVTACRQQLEQALQRKRQAGRIKLGLAVAAILLVLLAGIGWGVTALRASSRASELEALRAKGSVDGVRDLVSTTREDPWLMEFAGLASTVSEAADWVENASVREALAGSELDRLEVARESGFADFGGPELLAKLREIGELIGTLPEGVRPALESRLTVVRNEAERQLLKRRESAGDDARRVIAKWREALKEVDYSEPALRAIGALSGGREALAPLTAMGDLGDSLLRLPAATESAVEDVDARIAEVEREAHQVRRLLVRLRKAGDAATYREVLTELAAAKFAEADQAGRILEAWHGEERLAAEIFFDGDIEALKAAEATLDRRLLVPEAAGKLDRETVSDLRDHDDLVNVWDLVWTEDGTRHAGYTRGELEEPGPGRRVGEVFERPPMRLVNPRFEEKKIHRYSAMKVVDHEPSAVAALMGRLGFSRLLDDTGTRYERSVLPLLDRIHRADEAPVLARAYLLSRLFPLIDRREFDWGVQFAPELRRDREAFGDTFDRAPVDAHHWMCGGQEDARKLWRDYFAERSDSDYHARVDAGRQMGRAAASADLELTGTFDSRGNLTVAGDDERRLLWGFRAGESERVELALIAVLDAGEAADEDDLPRAPLSPVMSLNLPLSAKNQILARRGDPPSPKN